MSQIGLLDVAWRDGKEGSSAGEELLFCNSDNKTMAIRFKVVIVNLLAL